MKLFNTEIESQESEDGVRDYILPEGCISCGADLPVRVTVGRGPQAVCKHCGTFSKPLVRMTADGLQIELVTARA